MRISDYYQLTTPDGPALRQQRLHRWPRRAKLADWHIAIGYPENLGNQLAQLPAQP
jgi:hypothetical protein